MDDTAQPRPEPPQTEAPEPGPAAAATPAGTWVVPPVSGPPTSLAVSRAFLIVTWIAAVLVVGFLALVRTAAQDADSVYRAGYGFGAFVIPFLVAAAARWVVVRLRRGKPGAPAGVRRSHWVPLGAIALAVLTGVSSLSALARTTPVDPATALRVGPGFSLRETDPATAQQVTELFGEQSAFGDVLVREVVGDDGSVSVLLIADGRLRDEDMAEMARGLGDGSGIATRVDSIGGKQVAVAVGSDYSMGSWIEEPLLLSVLAPMSSRSGRS